jgi:hypothetical protein
MIATPHPARSAGIARIAAALAVVALATAPAPSAAQPVQDLRHRTTFHESFGFLQSVRELADGRVVVADPLGGLLVALDLGSGAMTPIGREGGGPGEWRQPDAVYALPGDSTLLVDLGNARLTVIDPAGRAVRSDPIVLRPAGDEGARPVAGSDGRVRMGPGMLGTIDIIRPRATDRAGRVYFQGGGRMAGPGAGADSLEVKRWDRGDAPPVRLAGLRPPQLSTSTTGRSGGQGTMGIRAQPVPLAPQDDWAVAPDGRVAIVSAQPYRVDWVHPDGRRVTGTPVDYRPLPVRTAEKERWLEGRGSNNLGITITMQGGAPSMNFRRGGAMRPDADAGIDDYEWPQVLPPFRSGRSHVDPNGRLWVERYGQVGAPTVFDVFDRRGARVAQIRLPADRELIGFGRSAVYAARVDELGLYWIEAYDPPR